MADISQTTFSNAFSWMKIHEFRYFTEVRYFNIGSDNGKAPTRLQAIIWTNDGKFIDAYMRHPASMS